MSKHFGKRLEFQINEKFQEIKKEKLTPTSETVLQRIRNLQEYQRIPKAIVLKFIKEFFQKINLEQNVEKGPNNHIIQNFDENTVKTGKLEIGEPVQIKDPSLEKEKQNNDEKSKKKKRRNIDEQIEEAIEASAFKKIKMNNESFINRMPDLQNLGGLEKILPQLKQLIFLPLNHQDIFDELKVDPPRGILLTGPPGSGKTALGIALCKHVQQESGVKFVYRSATEMIGGVSGESENNIRSIFEEASELGRSILFIDDIDSIAGRKENASKDMERRVVTQLQNCLDSLSNQVMVIASSSKPESMDASLRRAGRFDREFCLTVPDEKGRISILNALTKNIKISEQVNINTIARMTPGYVPADLFSLIKESGLLAVERLSKNSDSYYEQMDDEIQLDDQQKQLNCSNIKIGFEDLQQALKTVQPTAKREGFAVVPDVTWDDIGALKELKDELFSSLILPITKPEKFLQFGIEAPAGVLLYGPPGCGKTLLAKAVANASQANFISVKGPELLNKWVGESEKAVRTLFQRARFSSPCIIFFDELDALCPKRGNEGNSASERVVNQLLTELQGLEDRKQVFIIAATNRPDIIDPAMLRPGRLDKLLYVPMPNQNDRVGILKALIRNCPIDQQIIQDISNDKRLEGFSGADLSALVKQAGLTAILQDSNQINKNHFEQALNMVMPSLSKKDCIEYENMRKNLREARNTMN